MKNKITVFGSKGIIFFCAIALAVVGLALTGCPTDEDDPGGGGAEFPAAWTGTGSQMWRVGGVYQGAGVSFSGDSMELGLFYNLKSFTGDGSSSGSFTVKQYNPYQSKEVGDEITVTYTYNATGPTITLVSADIESIASPGKTYTKFNN